MDHHRMRWLAVKGANDDLEKMREQNRRESEEARRKDAERRRLIEESERRTAELEAANRLAEFNRKPPRVLSADELEQEKKRRKQQEEQNRQRREKERRFWKKMRRVSGASALVGAIAALIGFPEQSYLVSAGAGGLVGGVIPLAAFSIYEWLTETAIPAIIEFSLRLVFFAALLTAIFGGLYGLVWLLR